MTVSVVSWNPPGSWAGTADISLTGLAWTSGDVIVVVAGVETTSLGQPSTPTNANLSFTLRASSTTGGAGECSAYVWSATAGSTETGQTVAVVRSTETGHWGAAAWVLTGTTGSVANATANLTEAGFTFTPTAGSGVCYFFADWSANATDQTLATGTGTGTERADSNSSQWAWFAGDWVGVAASSTAFGVSSYASLQVAHVVIEVLASETEPPPPELEEGPVTAEGRSNLRLG